MSSTPRHEWTQADADGLIPRPISPFTWSILGRSAERPVRTSYAELGYDLPADEPIWRHDRGFTYVNTSLLAEAEAAGLGVPAPVTLGQRLFGRKQDRQVASAARQIIGSSPQQLKAIKHWWERVQGMEWRQATILQIMEEIEPRAETALRAHYLVTATLSTSVYLLSQQVREGLPTAADELMAELMAGIEEDSGSSPYLYELALLGAAVDSEADVGNYLAAGNWDNWENKLPAGAFRRTFERFIAARGQWALQPLEAASPRWQEEPGRLLAYLAETRLASPVQDQTPDPQQLRQRREEAANRAGKAFGLLQRRQFEPAFRQVQDLVDLLPACRQALVSVIAGARFWAEGAAREALADGRLASRDEVFLLELEELKQMMTGEWSNPEQVRPILEERKA